MMAASLFKRIAYEVAVLISVATHPVLVFYGASCFLAAKGFNLTSIEALDTTFSLGIILLVTVIIPVLAQYGLSRSLFMEQREQRLAPLLVTAGLYLMAWVLLRALGAPVYLMGFLLSLVVGLTGLYLITRFYKLSVHTSAAGSLAAFFFSCF